MATCVVCGGSLRLLRDICPLCDGVPGWPEVEFAPTFSRGCMPEEGISVLSWNIFNKDTIGVATKENPHYNHLTDQERLWEFRFPKIIDEIKLADASVVCLQEINEADYSDIKSALGHLGYSALTQKKMQRNSLAIFFKQRFSQVWAKNARTKTLAVGLKDDSRTLAVVTCHLEGNPKSAADRLDQLRKAFAEISGMPHDAVVVAGDFNAPLVEAGCRSSAVTAYMSTGRVPSGTTEWSFEVKSTVDPHAYNLISAYPGTAASCILHGEGACLIDQMWFSQTLELVGNRDVFVDEQFKQDAFTRGLPTEQNPSDHLPLGAVFRWK